MGKFVCGFTMAVTPFVPGKPLVPAKLLVPVKLFVPAILFVEVVVFAVAFFWPEAVVPELAWPLAPFCVPAAPDWIPLGRIPGPMPVRGVTMGVSDPVALVTGAERAVPTSPAM